VNETAANAKAEAAVQMDVPHDVKNTADSQRKQKEFENKFNFNGLRSHLGSKYVRSLCSFFSPQL
jgi:hypothetical protein